MFFIEKFIEILFFINFFYERFKVFLFQGLNILIPILDSIKYVQILKEQAIKIPEQSAVTKGNNQIFLISYKNFNENSTLI